MNEGGITSWKKKEGESFNAGDVLLEIETDKATIDVEAQEDGVMGKILAADGTKNIPVGQVIALLAEQGDDISNLEAPKQQADAKPTPEPASKPEAAPSPPSSPPVTHRPEKHIELSRPLFPSVSRLLEENDVADPEKIKGTGVRGMLTKGDVLAYLGKASSPTGTFKETEQRPEIQASKKVEPEKVEPEKVEPEKVEPEKALDGPAIRRLIVGNFYQSSVKARASAAPKLAADFDSVIADYLPPSPAPTSKAPAQPPKRQSSPVNYLDGLD
ncbi:hypothetical protein EW146_g420 [Bondarzewia mesenterica]|uniref:Lipoyl-binding domain-containing protein n=1 Tax=Bondarzewia mesenterica TaxID=1095465 RepID=A0A4S4M7M2_9AGAM|nr:hypothetical protein EW146_g420 [Bondarzewia mesenterica]